MRIYSHTFLTGLLLSLFSAGSLHSVPQVTSNVDSTNPALNVSGTLRYALLNANPGDTISFAPTLSGSNTITLASSLPAINQSLLLIANAATPVTIDGASQFSVFSVASGTVNIQNLTIQHALSQGGAGGSGIGGGGGAAGGGALYIHNGSQVTINSVTLLSNAAQGGAGGAYNASVTGAGGGGGGFGAGSGSNTNAGGNSPASGNGGGGGGNIAGGNGGTTGAGSTGGILDLTAGGGGGGGSNGNAGGSAYHLPSAGNPPYTGGSAINGDGGGGAGAGGNGISGGLGGPGIGIDTYFGGGGGGGCANTSTHNGGAGWGTGGGGGGFINFGGAGGVAGGGGGGGAMGGLGGFGGGGGAGIFVKGGSIFGGGNGGVSFGGSAGGGGAAMGGAIFIQNGGTLIIQDNTSFSSNTVTGGTTPGTGGAQPGQALGLDLFVRSGGSLIFNNTSANLMIVNAILSDEEAGGTSGGGLFMNGSQTVTLESANNLYSGGTTINSGTISVAVDGNLGSVAHPATTGVTIGNGTLLITGPSFTSSRLFNLNGSATINTQGNTSTLSGLISGSGSLTKMGSSGTLILTNTSNTYSGGTNIVEGTIQIGSGGSLGSSTNSISIGTAALEIISGPIALSQSFNVTGTSTFNIGGNTLTLTGPINDTGSLNLNAVSGSLILAGNITGSGSVIMAGDAGSTMTLSGTNSYTGGTTISAGTMIGNSLSLQGNITDNSLLIFNQTTTGTFSGALSGIGQLTLNGGATLNITSNNSGFSGSITVSSGLLNVTGSLANASLLTINSGATLSGTGTVGSVLNSGTINSGSSTDTLNISGNLTLNPSSNVTIEISPTSSSLINVSNIAMLQGALTISPDSGFYGFSKTYEILDSANLMGTNFTSYSSTNSNFIPSAPYAVGNDIYLDVEILEPFAGFPYDSYNTKSVGNNLDALSAAGLLDLDGPLVSALNALVGDTYAVINNALDELHPASFSVFAEIQAAVGGQLLSLFHRRPAPNCACSNGVRLWGEPYGNWLEEKNIGEEIGFTANTQGVAGGIDAELKDGWTLGVGWVWNDSFFYLHEGRGHGTSKGYYGAFYTDYITDNFYIGASFIGGLSNAHSSRHIGFAPGDQNAKAARDNTEIMGQLAMALYFGPSMCLAFPYINIDYLYLKEGRAVEKGADGFNLNVAPNSSSTLRTEAGFSVQVRDINKYNTMCISPLFGLGWAMECPLIRHEYSAVFEDQPIPFHVKGWDYTWQLFTVRFGLTITYRCLSLYGGYVAEMSPLDHTPFFDQRGNVRLDYSW